MKTVITAVLLSIALPVALLAAEEIDLTTPANYSEHFRPMQDVSLFQATPSALVGSPAKAFYGGALYTPTGSDESYSEGSVEAAYSFKGEQGVRTVFHLIARYSEESQTAVVGRVLTPSASRIRLQILFNTSPYLSPHGQAPETLIDWEYDLEGGGEGAYRPAHHRRGCQGGSTGASVPPETVLVARLEQREAPDRAFCLSLFDEGGRLLGTTGFQALPTLDSVAGSGAVGLGAYIAQGDEIHVRSFKFSAPTP